MKRLILGLVLFAALAGLAHAQGNGNVVRLIGSGAPTGGCSPIMEWNDITNGNIYWCGSSNGGSSYGWLETNGGASFPLTSPSANPATSGELNLANNVDQVCWRNAANSADICIYVDNNNVFQFSGTGGISFDHATATSTTLPIFTQPCRATNGTPTVGYMLLDVNAACQLVISSNGAAFAANTGTVTSSGYSSGTPLARFSSATNIVPTTVPLSMGATFYNSGGLSSGLTVYKTMTNACTISAWNMTINAGSATVDIWDIATGTAVPTVTNTITASAVPTISGQTAIHSTTMTGWATAAGGLAISKNDIVAFNLKTTSGATTVNINVECDQ
jgi:hypothetical protein